jgi:hypothetical protein
MKRITADIFINSPHNICDEKTEYKIEHNGDENDKIQLSLETTCDSPESKIINEYKIERNGDEDNKIQLSLEITCDYSENKIRNELEQIAKLHTLVISKFEHNPKLGSPYFTLDWKNKNVVYYADINNQNNCMEASEVIQLSEKKTGKTSYSIKRRDLSMVYDHNYLYNDCNNILLDNYYHACVSDNHKTKFFYLYLIFEYYIKKECPKDNFKKKLFSDDEIKNLKEIVKISSENYEQKQNAIGKLDNKILKEYHENFYEYLASRKINTGNGYFIKSDDIKKIIDQRNDLFHESSELDIGLLYSKLFPLIRELLLADLFAK